jgi:hypothetical protein
LLPREGFAVVSPGGPEAFVLRFFFGVGGEVDVGRERWEGRRGKVKVGR